MVRGTATGVDCPLGVYEFLSFGGYQLFLQLRAVARDGAPLSAVTDVLPGIGIMAGVLVLGFWLFRRRARFDTALLLEAFERAIADRSSG